MIIVLEGPDCSGKTTLAEKVSEVQILGPAKSDSV